jgi:hypothetical protein
MSNKNNQKKSLKERFFEFFNYRKLGISYVILLVLIGIVGLFSFMIIVQALEYIFIELYQFLKSLIQKIIESIIKSILISKNV